MGIGFDRLLVIQLSHWDILLSGSLDEVTAGAVPLGVVEAYNVNNTYYVQNPEDGSWITLPGFLVNTMAPDGVPTPEEGIELPLMAVRQPGVEIVNGIVTQQYIFGLDDLADQIAAKYESVDGTIWVAIDDNYVVKYEATISGQSSSLKTESLTMLASFMGTDLSLPDEGTVILGYELSDLDGDTRIELPAGLGGFNLFSSLGNLLFQ